MLILGENIARDNQAITLTSQRYVDVCASRPKHRRSAIINILEHETAKGSYNGGSGDEDTLRRMMRRARDKRRRLFPRNA